MGKDHSTVFDLQRIEELGRKFAEGEFFENRVIFVEDGGGIMNIARALRGK